MNEFYLNNDTSTPQVKEIHGDAFEVDGVYHRLKELLFYQVHEET